MGWSPGATLIIDSLVRTAFSAVRDGSDQHFDGAHEGLRRRVRAEVKLTLSLASPSCTEALLAQLQTALKRLQVECWIGRGVRAAEKSLNIEWLVPQIFRTLERLLPEPSLRQERIALQLALRVLEAR